MSKVLFLRAGTVITLIAALSLGGCAATQEEVIKEQEKPSEITAIDKGVAEVTDEHSEDEMKSLNEEELRNIEEELRNIEEEDLRIIEEKELAEKERLAEEEAKLALQNFIPHDVYFNLDRSDLSSSARDHLYEIADWMDKLPSVKIKAEGHADERGSSEYNLALGERRAESAKRYLFSLGIGNDRLSTVSYGEEMPANEGQNESAWAKNRRVHFEVTER